MTARAHPSPQSTFPIQNLATSICTSLSTKDSEENKTNPKKQPPMPDQSTGSRRRSRPVASLLAGVGRIVPQLPSLYHLRIEESVDLLRTRPTAIMLTDNMIHYERRSTINTFRSEPFTPHFFLFPFFLFFLFSFFSFFLLLVAVCLTCSITKYACLVL